MNRRLLINVGLAIAVAALGAWMILEPGPKGAPEIALSDRKPAEARSIRIERNGLPTFVLLKSGGRWRQTEPFSARTDNTQAQRLLDLLAAKSRTVFPADDLARFELDHPFARVTIDDRVFAFGTVNPLTGEQYVLSGNKVFLLSPVFGYGLPTQADSMTTHMLLGDDETPVAFELASGRLESKDGKSRWTPPTAATEKLSQDDVARWLDDWRFASSLATRPATAAKAGEAVRITMKDGKNVEFQVLTREPEFILRRLDEKLEFVFAADRAQRLLSPPSAAK